MKHCCIIISIFLLFSAVLFARSENRQAILVKITNVSNNELKTLISFNIDIENVKNKSEVYAYVTIEEYNQLTQKGYQIEEIPDRAKIYADSLWSATQFSSNPLDAYHTFEELTIELQQFAQQYPEICLLESIGKSVHGKDLWIMKITDNVTIEEYMEYDPVIGKKNPHVWMSPINAKNMIFKLYQTFAQLLPENNATLYNNFLSYQKDLDDLLKRIDQAKETFNNTKVVVHHPAFVYFFNLLGLERIGAIEEVEGAEPSAAHIADLTDKMLQEECKFIINQPQLDKEDVEALALDTDAKIAVLTPLLGVEVEDSLKAKFGDLIDEYIEMFDYDLYKLAHPYNPSFESTSGLEIVSILSFLPLCIALSTTRKRRKDS